MNDFSINFDELLSQLESDSKVTIEEKRQIHEIINKNLDENALTNEMDNLAKEFMGEDVNSQAEWALVSGGNRGSFVEAYKKELYKLICTDSEKYKEERLALSTNTKNLLQIGCTIAVSYFSVSLAVVSGVVYCILIPILKLGKNAYCSISPHA